MSKKGTFIKNSISGVFQKLIVAILTFFTIPIFIAKLGSVSYGIFATVSVIGDLSRIANIGFHIALIKYLSLQGKTKESSIDIIVGFASMFFLIVPMSVVLLIWNDYFLIHVLNVSMADLPQSRILFNYLVLANIFLFLGLVFSAMLESQRKIFVTNFFQLIYSILYWSLMLISLSFGEKLDTIGLMAFIAAFIWFLLMAYSAFKEWGKLSTRGLFKLYLKSVKKQLSYGLQIYASGLMGLFGEPLVKVLVANFLGHTYVGVLDIGIRIRNQLGRIFDAALSPLFQLFAEMTDVVSKSKIVKEIQEKSILVLLPVAFMILFGAKPFVSVWIGNNIELISMTLKVVTIGSIFGFLVFGAMSHYLGVDKPILLFVESTISNIIYSGAILMFYKHIGYTSVYLSFILAYIVNIIFTLYFQKKYLNSLIFDKAIQIISLLLYILTMLFIGWILTLVVTQPIILLIIIGVLFPLISLILYISFSLINENDIERYFGKSIFGRKLNLIVLKLSPIIIIKNNRF
jgi:O-antigen/teichoic acid export membrane protein